MSITNSLFCEHCGAANEEKATICCFCSRPLDEIEPDTASPPISPSPDTLSIGTLLKARYRIIKAVGQGGMGTVYQAQDTGLNNRAVAIKELIVNEPDARHSQEAIEAFQREATLLAGLQHANLPSVFEHFKENGRWYMAMTFIQGQTLEEYLTHTNRAKLPLHEVIEIGKQLSSVLYYLHNQYPPIIFRDVKPANIMRTPDGRIYLIDFGVARRFKSGQKKDTIPFGSIGYAAPEQFGKAQTTPRSDIYSLGATLYELLSGHEPASSPLKFPPIRTLEPSTPFKMATLLAQMLDTDESKRPANMLIVEQRLQEIDSTPWQATSSPSYSANSTLASNRPSRSVLSTLGILLAFFCLIVGGVVGDLIGTANTNTTYQADAVATTSADANATATAVQVAALPDPYAPQGKLVVVDPLSQANTWQEQSDPSFGGQCQFKQNSLQITQSPLNKFYHCDESTIYQNFTIQVQMTIQQGDCGGISLRENADDSMLYMFDVCASDGTYYFYHYTSYTAADTLTTNYYSKAINQGAQSNTLAVVADGDHFDLYVNHQKVDSVTDTSYNSGTIGLIADAINTSTTVSYQNVMIWALP